MSTERLCTRSENLNASTPFDDIGYRELKVIDNFGLRRTARESNWNFDDALMEFPGQWSGDVLGREYTLSTWSQT